MEDILLHHPVVQLYLICVAALIIALIWDHLRTPPTDRSGSEKIRDRGRSRIGERFKK